MTSRTQPATVIHIDEISTAIASEVADFLATTSQHMDRRPNRASIASSGRTTSSPLG